MLRDCTTQDIFSPVAYNADTIQVDLKNAKLFKSDKEFEADVAKICTTLKDTQTADWKQRVNAMK